MTANLQTAPGPVNASITKERKASVFTTLVKMESLRNHFRPRQNIVDIKSTNEINSNTQKPEPVTPNQNNILQPIIDPKQIEINFENPESLGTPNSATKPNNTSNNHSTKATEKQRNSKKVEDPKNYVSFQSCGSQNVKDILPKRVSFNDIPDVIAAQRTGNKAILHLADQEAGWSSDYSEDDTGETSTLNQVHCNKQCK